MDIDVEVDERTLREIYLSAFEATVKAANPWTVMASAHSKLRGALCERKPVSVAGDIKGRVGL